MNFIESMYHYINTVCYMLIKHLGLSLADTNNIDFSDAMMLIAKNNDEQENRNMWEFSLQGGDVKKVPAFNQKLLAQEKKRKMAKAVMPEAEAKSYKNIFKKVLDNGIR